MGSLPVEISPDHDGCAWKLLVDAAVAPPTYECHDQKNQRREGVSDLDGCGHQPDSQNAKKKGRRQGSRQGRE